MTRSSVTTHKKCSKLYNKKCTYSINAHLNLLYALKYGTVRALFKREVVFFLLNQVTFY